MNKLAHCPWSVFVVELQVKIKYSHNINHRDQVVSEKFVLAGVLVRDLWAVQFGRGKAMMRLFAAGPLTRGDAKFWLFERKQK